MSGVTRYRRAAHTRRLNKMKLPKMPKRKICFRCQRDGLRHSRVERFFARWTCRSCGAACCEHLCGCKDGDKATCVPCIQESAKLAPRKTGAKP